MTNGSTRYLLTTHGERRRTALSAVWLLVACGLSTAHGARPTPTACPSGSFSLSTIDAARIGANLALHVPSIEVEGGTVAVGGCRAPARVRVTRRKTTLRAKWSECAGLRKVTLTARITAPECGTMKGKLRVKRRGAVSFTAVRSVSTSTTTTSSTSTTTLADACGNGVIDAGEECELDRTCGRRAYCTPFCVCQPVPGTRVETSQLLIDDAYRSGTIDLGTALLYRAHAIFRDPRLPAEFDGVGSDEEDLTLSIEIAEAWPTLPPDQQAALHPFLVRPNHPDSIFSTAYGTAAPVPLAARAALPESCASVNVCPKWVSSDGPHLRVWSCEGAFEASRANVLTEAEALYGAISSYMGEPVPDVVDNEGGTPKIDIYLVELNQSRPREGNCEVIPGQTTRGMTISDAQYLVTPGGVRISSGYVLIPIETVLSPTRRSTLAHELFHVAQLAHSLPAYATWLTDATATWAQWYFVPEHSAEVHQERFVEIFQRFYFESLDRDEIGLGDYHRYIWFFFAEQEVGADVVKRLYRRVENPVQPTRAVDELVPLATHWATFAVRNLNASFLPNLPEKVYRDRDGQFPYPQPITDVEQLGEVTIDLEGKRKGVKLSPLAGGYHRLTVNDSVRELTFDFSELIGGSNVVATLLLRTSEPPDPALAQWERRDYGPEEVVICRDTGDRRVYEAYIVLGNRDWRGRADVEGTFEVTGRPACCPSGKTCWSGTASGVHDFQTEYGAVRMHADANVTWLPVEADPTGGTFQPKGSVRYTADVQVAGDCTISLSPTTLTIGPSSGLLQFFKPPGQVLQYLALGNGGEGTNLLSYRVECPDVATNLPGDAKPWLTTGAPRNAPEPGKLLEGTYSSDGSVYSWKFAPN